MLFTDSYNQIQLGKLGFYKELGSKFIAYPFLVYNKKDINDKISFVKKKKGLPITIVMHIYYIRTLLLPERTMGASQILQPENQF